VQSLLVYILQDLTILESLSFEGLHMDEDYDMHNLIIRNTNNKIKKLNITIYSHPNTTQENVTDMMNRTLDFILLSCLQLVKL
jgi:hypothetical protein